MFTVSDENKPGRNNVEEKYTLKYDLALAGKRLKAYELRANRFSLYEMFGTYCGANVQLIKGR